MPGTLPPRFHRTCAGVVQQHLIDLHIGQDGEVAALGDRAQERLGRIPANAPALVDLKVSTALVVAGVEVVELGDAALLGGIAKCIKDRPTVALTLDPPLAAGAMMIASPGKVILAGLEQR
ncbi:hypothetical protein D3C71_1695930 [compost metagenome]